MHDRTPWPNPRWGILLAGAIVAVAASLTVHVVMLQVLDVPYPGNLPSQGWARLPDRLLGVFGAATLCAMLPPRVRAWRGWARWGLLTLVFLTIHETLLRIPIMNIFTASRWTGWPFLDAVPAYLVGAAAMGGIVAAGSLLATPIRRLAVTLAVGVPVYMILAPLLAAAFAGVVRWTAAREGYTFYQPPYDWHVEVPAYITFVEPVAAAFVVAALVSARLPRDPKRAFVVLALLLFALRGHFFSTVVNIRYAGTDAVTAMLSFGQFAFESLALAMIVAASWVLATRRPG